MISDDQARNSLFLFAFKYKHLTPPDEWNPEPLHAFICNRIQQAIQSGERIIISVPPQHGKSQIASVYAPIWYLSRNPKRNVALVSYSADLAEAKSVQARTLARASIDTTLSPEVKSRKNWALTGALDTSFRARGVGGGLTGHAIDLLILDDLIKNHEEAESKTHRDKIASYIESSLMTRLSKEAIVILILTRWHMDDYAVKLHRQWGWPMYNIPAICDDPDTDLLGRQKGEVAAPLLKPIGLIEGYKRDLSHYVFSALYQGKPTGHESARIRKDWFKYYPASEAQRIADRYNVYQTVDTSATDTERSAYFVVLTFAIVTKDSEGTIMWQQQDFDNAQRDKRELLKHIYLLDVLRQRFETTEHEEVLRIQREKWRPIYQYVEATTYGLNILQAAEKKGLPLKPLKADKSKFLRSEQIHVNYKNGQVWHPDKALWLEEFEEEIANFPVAAHDDQFDALAYAGIVAAGKNI